MPLTDYEPPHPSELLAEFALGVLSEREAARVREYIAQDPDAMAEVEEMLRVARLLPFAADNREPANDLRPGLMERISQEPITLPLSTTSPGNVTPMRRRPAWLMPIAAAAAAFFVLAAGVGGYALGDSGGNGDLEAEAGRQENLLVAVANGRAESASATDGNVQVSVVHEVGGHDAFTWVQGLPALPDGKAYQAWFTQDMAAFEPGPVFDTSAGGVWLTSGLEFDRYAAMAFTIEDAAGVQQPTQAPFVVVPLEVTARR